MRPLFTSGEPGDPPPIWGSTGGPYLGLLVYGIALALPFISLACAATLAFSAKGRTARFGIGLILISAAMATLKLLVY